MAVLHASLRVILRVGVVWAHINALSGLGVSEGVRRAVEDTAMVVLVLEEVGVLRAFLDARHGRVVSCVASRALLLAVLSYWITIQVLLSRTDLHTQLGGLISVVPIGTG